MQYELTTPLSREALAPLRAGDTVLLSGIRVGKGAMTAAGSIITRNVPDYALMVGAPAKIRGYVCACGEKLPESLCCSRCGRRFRLTAKGLQEKKEENP